MREFSDFEKQIIHKIVDAREQEDIQRLDLAKIIREAMSVLALEWTENPSNIKLIYLQEDDARKAEKKYPFRFFDIIFLIKYLEDEGYVFISKLSIEPTDKFIYKRDEFERANDGKYWIKKDQTIFGYSYQNATSIHLDLANLLSRYGSSIIYPSPVLVDVVKNDFKSVEYRRFKKQMDVSLIAAVAAIAAFIIACVTTWITLRSEAKIDSTQFNELNRSIQRVESAIPASIHDYKIADTLKVEVVKSVPNK